VYGRQTLVLIEIQEVAIQEIVEQPVVDLHQFSPSRQMSSFRDV
jgi:hypothetical protein